MAKYEMQLATPETIAVEQQSSRMFWRTVWTMPPHLRCVVTHLYICDKSFEESAQILGITPLAVRLLHDRALADLKLRIETWR